MEFECHHFVLGKNELENIRDDLKITATTTRETWTAAAKTAKKATKQQKQQPTEYMDTV